MPRNGSFRRDEAGVSEVVGYLFAFFITFVILVTSLSTFGTVQDTGRRLSAQAQMDDLAQRISLGVQDAYTIALARNATTGTADSSIVRFERQLDIPLDVQGYAYRVTLDSRFVNVTASTPNLRSNMTTYNLLVGLPASGCPAGYAVCTLAGLVVGSQGRASISYLFNKNSNPIVNEIRLG